MYDKERFVGKKRIENEFQQVLRLKVLVVIVAMVATMIIPYMMA